MMSSSRLKAGRRAEGAHADVAANTRRPDRRATDARAVVEPNGEREVNSYRASTGWVTGQTVNKNETGIMAFERCKSDRGHP